MSLNTKTYSTLKVAKDKGGFTLVETIVALAILAILCVVVAGIIMFGMNLMQEQRARANADMLCSMLTESIEDALEGSESFTASGDTIEFVTATGTSYRPAGTYALSTSNGNLILTKKSNSQTSTIIPTSSYIDGMTEECTFTKQENNSVKVSLTIKKGGNTMASNEFTVKTLAGGQS